MRPLVPTLAVALVAAALAVPVLTARADNPNDVAARFSRIELEMRSLRADAAYLRAREVSTTRYLASLSTAVQHLSEGIARSRSEGFEAAAISGPSRVELLHALDGLASDLSAGIPVLSKDEIRLLAQAEDLRKQLPR